MPPTGREGSGRDPSQNNGSSIFALFTSEAIAPPACRSAPRRYRPPRVRLPDPTPSGGLRARSPDRQRRPRSRLSAGRLRDRPPLRRRSSCRAWPPSILMSSNRKTVAPDAGSSRPRDVDTRARVEGLPVGRPSVTGVKVDQLTGLKLAIYKPTDRPRSQQGQEGCLLPK